MSAGTGGTAFEVLAASWDAAAKRNRVNGQLAIDQGNEVGSDGFVYAATFEHCAAELRATIAAAAQPAPGEINGHSLTTALRLACEGLERICQGTADEADSSSIAEKALFAAIGLAEVSSIGGDL